MYQAVVKATGGKARGGAGAGAAAIMNMGQPRKLTSMIENTLHRIWRGPLTVFSPDDTLQVMWEIFPRFSGFRQQDVDEFLRAVVDRLEEEGKASKFGDPVTALLKMQTVCTLTCGTCHTASPSVTTSSAPFTVQIPAQFHNSGKSMSRSRAGPMCTLKDCLEACFVSEDIPDYFCSKCGKSRSAVKSAAISTTPDVLVIHIMRTSWALGGAKITSHVNFPLTDLDLSPYLGADADPGLRSTSAYALSAVVEHHGRGVSEGHYTAYGRNEDVWMLFNDHRVSVVTKEDVQGCQGYLLFYERQRS